MVGAEDLAGFDLLGRLTPAQLALVAPAAVALDTGRLQALAAADPALGYALSTGLLDAALARLQATRSRIMDLYGSPRER